MSEQPRQAAPDQLQRDRIDRELDQNLLVAAGAGSGKTTKLVDRYLRLLEIEPPEAVVVVTFTRKAAAEMKTRAREALRRRSAAATGPAEQERWLRAARSIEEAPIETMDAFCARLLRAEAMSAGLDPGFEVLDEVGQQALRREVVSQVVRERLWREDSHIARLIAGRSFGGTVILVEEALDQADEWASALADPPSHPVLLKAFRYLRHEYEVPPTSDELAIALADATTEGRREWLVEFDLNPFAADARLTWALLAPIAARAGADKFLPTYELVAKVLDRERDAESRLAALAGVAQINLRGGSAKVWGDAFGAAKDVVRELRSQLGDTQSDPESDLLVAETTAALLPVLREAVDTLSATKQARGVLEYSDLLRLTAELLTSPAAGEVVARVRRRYRRVLVDEYQDSNRLQDRLFRLLAGDRPGGFFAVGDDKQSIYGFRGGEIEVFNRARLAAGEGLVPLTTTFRLTQLLADVLNALFDSPALMGPEEHVSPKAARYARLEAMRRDERVPLPGAAVRFMLPLAPPKGSDLLASEVEAAAIVASIERLVHEERPEFGDRGRDGGCRPVSYGDIAILVRVTARVEDYREALLARGIPVRTDRGTLTRRPEVLDLLALARWLESPQDDWAMLTLLRGPLIGLSDAELTLLGGLKRPPTQRLRRLLRRLPEGGLRAEGAAEKLGLEDAATCQAVDRATALLAEWTNLRRDKSLALTLHRILDRQRYRAHLAALPDPQRRLANLDRALAELAGLEASGHSADEAIAALESRRDHGARSDAEALVFDADADAVTIATVHGAKGLEWPVVYLASLDTAPRADWSQVASWQGVPLPRAVLADGKSYHPPAVLRRWLDSGPALGFEAERLLYVGCTRARDRLILSGLLTPDKEGRPGAPGQGSWLAALLQAAVVTLPDDYLNDAALPPGAAWEPIAEPERLEPPSPRLAAAALERLADFPRGPVDWPALRAVPAGGQVTRYVTAVAYHDANKLPPAWFRTVDLPPAEPVCRPDWLGATERGTAIHDVMCAAAWARREPTEEQARAALLRLQPASAAADGAFEAAVQDVLAAARRAWSDAVVQRAIGMPRRLIEAPFAAPLPDGVLEGRFDLAAVGDGELIVIDYKTGRPAVRETQWEYRVEVSLYAWVLSRRHPEIEQVTIHLPLVDLGLELTGDKDFRAIAENALSAVASAEADGDRNPRA